MSFRVERVVLALLAVATLAAGPAAGADGHVVAVGIPPLAWVVRGLAGDSVSVATLIKPGQSPHTFEPTARQVAMLGKATVFLYVGTEMELTVAARATAQRQTLQLADVGQLAAPDHPHDAEHHHHDDESDPHIWLAPPQMRVLTTRCAAALRSAFPDLHAVINAGETQTLARIATVDAEISALLRHADNAPFLVYHPSWGHFARTYHLRQIALEADGKAPSARHLASVSDMVGKNRIKTIFSNPDAPETLVRRAAATLGCGVITVDPLAGDWDTNLLKVARLLAKSLPQEESEP